jgi:hypothetical protein
MKTLIGTLLLIFPGIVVVAQQKAPTQPIPPIPPLPALAAPRVIGEIANGNSTVKGAPFSAEAISESVQTLADGNHITRKWSEKLYRSTDGKFRREGTGTGGTALGWTVSADNDVTVLDPVGGFRYTWDPDSKTGHSFTYRLATPVVINRGADVTRAPGENRMIVVRPQGDGDKETTIAAEKAVVELKAAQLATDKAMTITAQQVQELKAAAAKMAGDAATTVSVFGSASGGFAGSPMKFDTRTEQLGTQNFEGVEAEGTRTITTIPADAIGNERPIEIVYERWYSKELQMIVYSKHSDPRYGEQTYRLTNINRSEPDPSLFEVPAGYKITSQTAPGAYKIMATPKPTTRVVPVKNNFTASTVTKP